MAITGRQIIFHQEALCSRMLPFGQVMKIVTKIVNFIRAAPFQRRLFKALLENPEDPEDPDLILHTEVRWFSKGKVLIRFENFELMNGIIIILLG